jgi:hypothetical protein
MKMDGLAHRPSIIILYRSDEIEKSGRMAQSFGKALK